MKAKTPLILVLALTTLGAGLLAWRQYQELVELRAAAMNTDERSDLQKRLWELERANRELADRLAADRGQGLDNGGIVAGNPDERPPAAERSKGGRGDARGRGPNSADQLNALRDLMTNPEIQALMTSQQKAAIDARYAALFKSLNFSSDQAEKLKTLLAERQATRMDILEVARAQGIDPRTNPEAYRKLLDDARNETNASIKSVIGETGFAQLTNYEQTMPQRNLVNDLQQRLSYTNTPLNSGQADQLVQILANNSPQRAAPDGNPPAGTRPPRGPGGGRSPGFDMGFGGPGGIDVGGLLALGGAALGGPAGDGGRAVVPITTAAVNQAQAVLSQPQLAVLQQLQQQQQAQQKIQQLVRETLANQAKTSVVAPTTSTAPAGGTIVPPPGRKRGGG